MLNVDVKETRHTNIIVWDWLETNNLEKTLRSCPSTNWSLMLMLTYLDFHVKKKVCDLLNLKQNYRWAEIVGPWFCTECMSAFIQYKLERKVVVEGDQ